jgi:hypothetical protein
LNPICADVHAKLAELLHLVNPVGAEITKSTNLVPDILLRAACSLSVPVWHRTVRCIVGWCKFGSLIKFLSF